MTAAATPVIYLGASHLGRGPNEPVNPAVRQFYARLLDVLRRPAVRQGQWQLLECVPARDRNPRPRPRMAFMSTPTYSGERCIYHVPGGQFYDKTKPERCYATEEEARQDGCRRSRR